MKSMNDLYLKYDGKIPSTLRSVAKSGSIQAYTHRIARAAEVQFEHVIDDTLAQLRHQKTGSLVLNSSRIAEILSNQILYYRAKAIEARLLSRKNRA